MLQEGGAQLPGLPPPPYLPPLHPAAALPPPTPSPAAPALLLLRPLSLLLLLCCSCLVLPKGRPRQFGGWLPPCAPTPTAGVDPCLRRAGCGAKRLVKVAPPGVPLPGWGCTCRAARACTRGGGTPLPSLPTQQQMARTARGNPSKGTTPQDSPPSQRQHIQSA